MLIGSLGAREDCAEGLLKRIAQKDCLVGLGGCVMGLNWFFSSGGLICRVRGSQVGIRALGAGNLATWLGSHVPHVAGARIHASSARLVWDVAARGAFAACAVERRALCAAGQRGGGVGAQRAAHKYRSPAGGL